MIPMGGTGTTKGALVPYGSKVDATGKLSYLQALKDPKKLGMAIRENKILAASTPSLTYSAGEIGVPLAIDTAKGFANFLVPGTKFDPFGPKEPKETGADTKLKRTDKITVVPNDGTSAAAPKTEAEKTKINEDRINETREKYYKLMGIDKMNKKAAYNSLIDASKIVSEEGGDLKGSIRSGNLQNRIISAISKNLDSSADLKKQINAAILKGEIEKDINASDPKSIADLAYKEAATKKLNKELKGNTTAEIIQARMLKDEMPTGSNLAGLISINNPELNIKVLPTKDLGNADPIDYMTEIVTTVNADETTPDYPAGVYVLKDKVIQITEEGSVIPVPINALK